MTDARYSADDAASAPSGHHQFVDSDVEVVTYRRGDNLVMLVNKGAVGCIYRATLHGAFTELNPVMQYPISDGFRIVDINGSLTLADNSGAFERVEQTLRDLGRLR